MRPQARTAWLALGLTTFFVVLSFPYGRYGSWFASRLAASLGSEVRVGEIGPALSWGGPVLRASGVVVQLPDGRRFDVDELRLRPALSVSWLWLDPAIRLWLESAQGRVDGTLWIGGSSGFSGSLRDVDLEALAAAAATEGFELQGRADLELDLESAPEGLAGLVVLEAREGSVAFPPYGLPVPFAQLQGRFELHPESGVEVSSFELEDPALSLHAEGSLGSRPSLAQGRLDLQGELEVRNPGLRAVLGDTVRLDRQGRAALRLQGTLDRPVLR